MIPVRDFDSVQCLNNACEALLREVLQAETATPCAAMLSGGRTPLALFQQIAENPFTISSQAWLTYTDDRHVPTESPQSNFGATLPMINALGLPLDRVIRVDATVPLEISAARYHADFVSFFNKGGRIALAFLGMGADGHTCSLFTQEDIDRGAGKLASPTWRPAPPHRVTVTPGLLERCDHIIFLVTGADKAGVIRQLLEDPTAIPAGRATANCPHVELWRA